MIFRTITTRVLPRTNPSPKHKKSSRQAACVSSTCSFTKSSSESVSSKSSNASLSPSFPSRDSSYKKSNPILISTVPSGSSPPLSSSSAPPVISPDTSPTGNETTISSSFNLSGMALLLSTALGLECLFCSFLL